VKQTGDDILRALQRMVNEDGTEYPSTWEQIPQEHKMNFREWVAVKKEQSWEGMEERGWEIYQREYMRFLIDRYFLSKEGLIQNPKEEVNQSNQKEAKMISQEYRNQERKKMRAQNAAWEAFLNAQDYLDRRTSQVDELQDQLAVLIAQEDSKSKQGSLSDIQERLDMLLPMRTDAEKCSVNTACELINTSLDYNKLINEITDQVQGVHVCRQAEGR